MNVWIDISYLKQLGPRLDRFTIKKETSSSFLVNCRCPYCGDSTKSTRKARGYFSAKSDSIVYHCHNCGASLSFGHFLKDFDSNLFQQYCLDKFKESGRRPIRNATKKPELNLDLVKTHISSIIEKSEIEEFNANFCSGLVSMNELSADHPAFGYVRSRMLPEKLFGKIFYAKKFVGWAKKVCDRFDDWRGKDHPRLVIPWYSASGKIVAFQARAFGDEQPKYYSIKLDEKEGKFFGLERIDVAKPIRVVEGPIDSMFIDNCVAVGSSALMSFEHDNSVLIYDNEPRNAEITKLIGTAIDKGRTVVIWPKDFEFKDINDSIVAGYTINQLEDIIVSNTCSGMMAKTRFSAWKK